MFRCINDTAYDDGSTPFYPDTSDGPPEPLPDVYHSGVVPFYLYTIPFYLYTIL